MIDEFKGQYFFLSNFYQDRFFYKEQLFKSSEQAFMWEKTTDPVWKDRILLAPDPSTAKRLGRSVPLREDWEQVKDSIMYAVLLRKFYEPTLRPRLLATGDQILVEGNNWNDTYWGVDLVTRKGRNQLGITLMKVREHYQMLDTAS